MKSLDLVLCKPQAFAQQCAVRNLQDSLYSALPRQAIHLPEVELRTREERNGQQFGLVGFQFQHTSAVAPPDHLRKGKRQGVVEGEG